MRVKVVGGSGGSGGSGWCKGSGVCEGGRGGRGAKGGQAIRLVGRGDTFIQLLLDSNGDLNWAAMP